jgi:hypothetical protein
VAIAVVSALVLGFVVLRKDKGVALPATLGVYGRVTDDQVRGIERTAKSVAAQQGVDDVQVAVYGETATKPAILLMAFSGVPKNLDQKTFLDGFQSGLTSSSVGANASPAFQRDASGTTVTCTEITTGTQKVTACAWTKKGVIGILVGFPVLAQEEVVILTGEAATALR